MGDPLDGALAGGVTESLLEANVFRCKKPDWYSALTHSAGGCSAG